MSIGEKFVEFKCDDETVKLGKLTVYDRAKVLKDLKAKRRLQLKQIFTDVSADKGEMIASLLDFDQRDLSDFDLFDHVKTVDGKRQSFEISLAKHYKPEEVTRIMEVHGTWLFEQFDLLMVDIWGFTLKEPEAAPVVDDDPSTENQVPSITDPMLPEQEMYSIPTPANP